MPARSTSDFDPTGWPVATCSSTTRRRISRLREESCSMIVPIVPGSAADLRPRGAAIDASVRAAARRRRARTASRVASHSATACQSGSSSSARSARTQERTDASCSLGSASDRRPRSPRDRCRRSRSRRRSPGSSTVYVNPRRCSKSRACMLEVGEVLGEAHRVRPRAARESRRRPDVLHRRRPGGVVGLVVLRPERLQDELAARRAGAAARSRRGRTGRSASMSTIATDSSPPHRTRACLRRAARP